MFVSYILYLKVVLSENALLWQVDNFHNQNIRTLKLLTSYNGIDSEFMKRQAYDLTCDWLKNTFYAAIAMSKFVFGFGCLAHAYNQYLYFCYRLRGNSENKKIFIVKVSVGCTYAKVLKIRTNNFNLHT